MILPSLTGDEIEGPTIFVAVILAYTIEPHIRLYGAASRLLMGIIQVREFRIGELEPSQSTRFVLKVPSI